jgi:CubicO group peptidase (beta-lactamase class C family)
MKRVNVLRWAVAALLLLTATATFLGQRSLDPLPAGASAEQVSEHMDAVLEAAMQRYSIAGVSAGVIREGEVIWRAREGQRSGDGRPVTDNTAYNLGSISKPLAVWTVLSLAQQRQIDLDAPVSRYLVRYTPSYGAFDPDTVTVRRLLQHTAGTNLVGYGGYGAHEDQPEDAVELSERFAPITVVREPGTARRYSGGGYVLLQILVEDVTGEAFDEVARRQVLDPLGMTDSGFSPNALAQVSEAFNYYRQPIESLRDVALTAAGGYASGADIERFLLAHRDGGGVLNPASLEAAFAPTGPSPAFAMSYTRWETPDGVLLGHGGNNSTWHGQIYIRPQTGDGFYFLTNATSGAQLDIDLSCAWLTSMGTDEGTAKCAESQGLARQLGWFSWGFGALSLLGLYWLMAGIMKRRRVLSLRPCGRGPLRLTGRLLGFVLASAASLFSAWLFWTNSVIWRTQTIMIDEIPLDELEGLSVTVTALFVVLAICLWSSPVRDEKEHAG